MPIVSRTAETFAMWPRKDSVVTPPSSADLPAECRLRPRRDNRTILTFGNTHIHSILGGLEQGAGLAFGAEFTTAESIPGVELRLSLITSSLFYFRGEVAAEVPKVFISYSRDSRGRIG